ncbi:hypothetical protein O181_045011 [Austropuccinia psidii MF-1]|uniref:Uncharacterized protein n=1 Tax=Austropuccinia psidii MF-1 TaxID=1389203 RepID=A0A9Q3DRI0_9BASI|nr:hypothetical protein [Austropuccinia psidii MF-1]
MPSFILEWLPPLQGLACLRARTPLQMRLQHCPPSPPSPLVMLLHPRLIFSLAYNPYAAAGPQFMPLKPPSPSLCLLAPIQHPSNAAYNPYTCSALLTCLRHSWSAFLTCLKCRLPSLHSYSAHPKCL